MNSLSTDECFPDMLMIFHAARQLRCTKSDADDKNKQAKEGKRPKETMKYRL